MVRCDSVGKWVDAWADGGQMKQVDRNVDWWAGIRLDGQMVGPGELAGQ